MAWLVVVTARDIDMRNNFINIVLVVKDEQKDMYNPCFIPCWINTVIKNKKFGMLFTL